MDKKLKKYLALAGSVTVGVTSADAQVVYTDVNPDFLLSGNLNTYALDLNNDSNTEFLLMTLDTLMNEVSSSYTYNFDVLGAAIRNTSSSNSWMVTANSSSGSFSSAPNPLAQGAVIGSSGQFSSALSTSSSTFGAPIGADVNVSIYNAGNLINSSSFFAGMFAKDQEGIMGLKFKINNAIHYGWARIEFTSNGQLSIKDYAYDATPNTPIIAGDNGTGLVGAQEQLNVVTISVLNNSIRIENKGANNDGLMVLTNISGQQIFEKQLKNNLELVDVSEFSTGIYLVKVISEDQSYIKKIYIK